MKTEMKKIFLIATIMLSLISCSDNILDITPEDRISDAAVWSDASLIGAYHTALYNGVLHGFKGVHMQSKATDEAINCMSWGINILPLGALSADNVTTFSSTDWTGGCGGLYYWDQGYQYIRKVNLFLEKMQTTTVTISNKAQLVAEAHFLRAYYYFLLLERFGGVPLVDHTYELGTTETFTSSSIDSTVDFINQDLTEALSASDADFPYQYISTGSNFGRATKDACLALRSRLFLYAASPLYDIAGNGKDLTKWQKAADAAKALIDRNDYTLYSSYRKCFVLVSGAANSEVIFSRNFTVNNSHNAPMYNLGRRLGAYGGFSASNGPSQNLVDDYDMTNGEPPFIWTNGVKTINPASGYDPQHPYQNRDPRFDASIIHDSTTYRGALYEFWVDSESKTWGYDSYHQSSDNPRGNYIIKKFMPDEDITIDWNTACTIPWIIFRLGEIYLNYAEAEFELGHEDVCREYINKIRTRAGMPDLPSTVTGETLRTRLYNERRIELAFEEHRYWDVRRWKIAMDVENRPLYGMDIIRNLETGTTTYTPVLLLDKKFYYQNYFLPISTTEIKKNKGTLVQPYTWTTDTE
jgi:starch-binding outer membrane protein, SusD/RagB family